MTSPFAACDCGLSMRRCKICGNGKRKPWRCCSDAALRSSVRIERRGAGDRDHLADSGRIEIERGKDLAQRLHGRGIKLVAVVDVEGGGTAGREAMLDQRVEFPREKMKRHVAAAIGVEQDQVVELAVAVEEHPSITGAV